MIFFFQSLPIFVAHIIFGAIDFLVAEFAANYGNMQEYFNQNRIDSKCEYVSPDVVECKK